MAGFIVLEDGRTWTGANWSYNAVIEAIVQILSTDDKAKAFAEWLGQQVTGNGFFRVDVREIAPMYRPVFREAARQAFLQDKETRRR